MSEASSRLAESVEESAAALGIDGQRVAGGRDYNVGELVIVEVREGTASFRMRPDVAAAAARTPDAGPSPYGAEWVAFTPRTFDRFAGDRVVAWFAFALRQAQEKVQEA